MCELGTASRFVVDDANAIYAWIGDDANDAIYAGIGDDANDAIDTLTFINSDYDRLLQGLISLFNLLDVLFDQIVVVL